jgi:glycosyltransferase involved in cell wall biosynthesis
MTKERGKTMRLLILTADYPPNNWSGVGVAVERQVQALAALGIDVHVLVATSPRFEESRMLGGEPSVHHLSRERCPVDPQRFDLVHLHSLALSEFALELRRRFSLPLVYTAHSLLHLELEDTPRARFWCAVQASMFVLSDWVVFLSNSERSAAIHLVPGLAACSSVIPNCVPPPPASLPPPPEDGSVVFAGRFARSKGVELLAEIIPMVLAQYKCWFVLAGGHGTTAGSCIVRDVAARFPQSCQVTGWLGRDELDELLAHAVLALVPSLYEPFGMIALEAMRLGTPVLSADVGGLSEIVVQGSGGRVVPSRDPAEWSEAIIEIVSTPAIARDLRRRGPEYVTSCFDPSRIAQRLRDTVYAL